MTQTQIIFLIGYFVIFIFAVAIFGLIWQTSKNKNKTKKHDPQSWVSETLSIYDRNMEIIHHLEEGMYRLSIKLESKMSKNLYLDIPIKYDRYVELQSEMIQLAIDEWKNATEKNLKEVSEIVLSQLTYMQQQNINCEYDKIRDQLNNKTKETIKDIINK